MIIDFFNLSLKNIRKKRLRSFLTLAGILISIATIFVLVSLSLGLQVAINDQFEKLGTDKFFIQPKGQFGPPGSSATAADLTDDDVKVIERISGVKDVTAYTIANTKFEFKDDLRFSMVLGFEPDELEVAFGSYDLQDGRPPRDNSKEVMLGYDYKYGDYLEKPVEVGNKVFIKDVEFRVVGIVEKIGNSRDDRQIYIPLSTLRDVFKIPKRVDAIIVQVNDINSINEVVDRVEKRLISTRSLKKDNTDFSVLTPEELLNTVGSVLDIVTYFLAGIAAISLIVGGINIANAMFTSVIERTKEIGVMKAIGAKNSDILTIFVIEAGLLGVVGGILGVLLGMGIGKIIEYIAINQLGTNLLTVVFPAYLILGSLVFAFFAGAVSGIWPAWRATKIRPVEALRYE